MKENYILSEYENFGQEINVNKLFQEDDEANMISSFNVLLVIILQG